MEFIWYAIAGVVGGLIGGMGMGGGTLLIPLLTIFYNVGQHTAQAINLISFIPMSVIALIIHFRNGYVETKNVIWIILAGVITCTASCFLANVIKGDLLKRLFGAFLLVLSICQFVKNIKGNKD